MIKVNQRAAGAGKTFEAVQMISSERQYSKYMYMTKAHSAKHVIYKEWEYQQRKGLIRDLELLEEPCGD